MGPHHAGHGCCVSAGIIDAHTPDLSETGDRKDDDAARRDCGFERICVSRWKPKGTLSFAFDVHIDQRPDLERLWGVGQAVELALGQPSRAESDDGIFAGGVRVRAATGDQSPEKGEKPAHAGGALRDDPSWLPQQVRHGWRPKSEGGSNPKSGSPPS